MKKTRLIIVDDHKILRIGLRSMLQPALNIEIVHEATGVEELFRVVDESINLILMDIDLQDGSGIDATRKLKTIFPEIKVLAVSMHDEPEYITNMVSAGASGYIMKDSSPDELVHAIHTIEAGEKYFSNQVSMALLKAINTREKKAESKKIEILSEREVEVLKLICQELSNSEIAEKLFISVRTVDSHRRNLLEKLNVKNTAGLVKYAFQKGYL